MEKRAVSTEHLYGRLVRRILERFGTEQRFSTEQRSGREGVGLHPAGTLGGVGCVVAVSGVEYSDPAFVPDGVALVFRGCGGAGDAGGGGSGPGDGWGGTEEAAGWTGEAAEVGEGLGAGNYVAHEASGWDGCGPLDGGGDAGGVSSV